MHKRSAWQGLLLGTCVMTLVGCNSDSPQSPSSSRLTSITTFNESGATYQQMRVAYGSAGKVTLRHYGANGETQVYRQECSFEEGESPLEAVTTQVVLNNIGGIHTGDIMLDLLGLPFRLRSCQEYFPGRPLAGERWLVSRDGIEQVPQEISVSREAEGYLVQRYFLPEMLLAMATGHAGYDESVRYLQRDGRVNAMIYGAEAWPESGSYSEYDNVAYDPFFLSLLHGLMTTAEGNSVSPKAGYAKRYSYDAQGQLEAVTTYRDWGPDEQWLTDDDVPDSHGHSRYFFDHDRLLRIETGLNPLDEQPTEYYRVEQYAYLNHLLHEKSVLDAQGRRLELWNYEPVASN